MANDKEIALYYPYINIADESLIKTSALYWDELQTIVPSGITDYYSTPILREAHEAKFLKPRIIASKDEGVLKAGREFVQDIKDNREVKQRILNLLTSTTLPELGYPDYVPFDMEKIDTTSLWHLCTELSKVHFGFRFHDGENLAMPKPLFYPYMSRLASILATENNAIPLTNEKQYQDVMLDRFIDYSHERRENQAQLATLSLKTLAINPEVPLVEILRFRDKNRPSLFKYRQHIQEIAWRIAKGLTTAEKEVLFEEMIKDKFLPVIDEIEAKLQENNFKFTLKISVISLAAIAGVAITGGLLAPLVTAGIWEGYELHDNIREERLIKGNHPLGYLYQAQQHFEEK